MHAQLAESGALINIPVAHNAGYTGDGVSVAVIDTGIDTDHPDLMDSIVWEECFLSDGGCPLTGGARASGPGSAEDDNDHGTHVSGIITSDNSLNKGIAPDAGIVALKVLDANGSGYTSDILKAIDWAIDNKDAYSIGVINMSLGGGWIVYSGECDAYNTQFAQVVQAAREAGIIVFAASGNGGLDSALSVPACLSAVVSVGAVYDDNVGSKSWSICSDETTQADHVACFSNSDTILDLLAPGSEITATVTGGGSATLRGTSMACPHAAAAAALLIEKYPGFTPDDIEMRLEETGIEVLDDRNTLSFPRIDIRTALNLQELKMTLPTNAREGDGTLAWVGKVDISDALDEDLEIAVASQDITEVIVETPVVTISAGQTSASFSISIVDDAILDGTRTVAVLAIADGDAEYSGKASMAVIDNEVATISVDIPPTAQEGDGVLAERGRINLDQAVDEDVTVFLESTEDAKVRVPACIAFSSGTQFIDFDLIISENVVISPASDVTITASVAGWIQGSGTIRIEDNDPAYYVNDTAMTNDIWCSAPGSDANDGLTPDTPKASVQAILDAYDVEPGDVVAIDTGTYTLESTIQVTTDDGGDATAPVAFVASPLGVVFDRQSLQSSQYVWHLYSSDYVQLRTTAGYSVSGVPQQWMKLTGGYGGLFIQGSHHCTVERVQMNGNQYYGAYLLGSDDLVFRNNLVANNGNTGLYASGSEAGTYLNNTVAQNGGWQEILLFESMDTVLRNNLIWADGENRKAIATYDDDPLNASDYNLFYLTGNAVIGNLDGVTYTTLLQWQTGTGFDLHSVSGSPDFVDSENGDWHLQSTGGSYHGGAWQADTADSPAIDAGNPADTPSLEPAPNGQKINLGAYGGTETASRSPSGRSLNLKRPNGDEIIKGLFTITWLAVGDGWQPDDTVKIEYSHDNGQSWNTIAGSVAAGEAAGDMGYEWDTSALPDKPFYLIRISSNADPAIYRQSEYWFTIHNGPIAYYVNDASLLNDVWCSAIGSGFNTGISPDAPADSLQYVIDTFDLEAGDTVYIDTGIYLPQATIQITATDQGSVDAPLVLLASPLGVVFDRQSDQSNQYVWHLNGCGYVHVRTAAGYPVSGVPQQWMKLTGGYGGLFLQGADHCTVDRVQLEGNHKYGICLLGSDDLVFRNNLVINNTDTGLYSSSSHEGLIVNNTVAQNGGSQEILLFESMDTVLRNNLIWADGENRKAIATYDDDPLNASDYNLFYLTGNAVIGNLDGVAYTTLLQWQTGTGFDLHSVSGSPDFVDSENGDWHLQSTGGSYHLGSWIPDLITSAAVDRGDPIDRADDEPEQNGDRINMGAFGGTAQASKSGDADSDGIPDDIENAIDCLDANIDDSDADGILDGTEDANHNGSQDTGETDPCVWDTDNDGMPDGYEVNFALNPLVDDASGDRDGDGFSNIREYVAGTGADDNTDMPSFMSETEDFETGDFSQFPWLTTGDALWSVNITNPYSGTYAAQAGAITDNQSTSLEISRYTEAGNFSFWYTVDSEQNYDWFYFYLDGTLTGQWSGAVPYTQAIYPLTNGMHHFKWEYVKDKSDLGGSDTAWIDDVTFPGFVDSDGDGMPDGWEIDHDMDALTDDAGDDADSDLFTNGIECLMGTDPRNPADFPIISKGFDADMDVDGSDLSRIADGLVSGIVTPAEVQTFAEGFGR